MHFPFNSGWHFIQTKSALWHKLFVDWPWRFFSRWLVSREQAKASELVQACWKTAGTLRELWLWIGGLRQSPKKVKCLPQNKVMLHFQKTYPSKMWIKYFEVLENPPKLFWPMIYIILIILPGIYSLEIS